MKQQELNFTIHEVENNLESNQHLSENRKHFTEQCKKVLELLEKGIRLTTINARDYRILSLPRRIADLKENGIVISEKWIKNSEGKRSIKEWFI